MGSATVPELLGHSANNVPVVGELGGVAWASCGCRLSLRWAYRSDEHWCGIGLEILRDRIIEEGEAGGAETESEGGQTQTSRDDSGL